LSGALNASDVFKKNSKFALIAKKIFRFYSFFYVQGEKVKTSIELFFLCAVGHDRQFYRSLHFARKNIPLMLFFHAAFSIQP
jgi:hypothetical protein